MTTMLTIKMKFMYNSRRFIIAQPPRILLLRIVVKHSPMMRNVCVWAQVNTIYTENIGTKDQIDIIVKYSLFAKG